MQRQKTIAKWLAILLLLTCTVACYIVFGTSLGRGDDGSSQIAGADGDNSDTPAPPAEQLPAPVYSEFPRQGELKGDAISHCIGGEEDEKLLDIMMWDNSIFAIFGSESSQHDVRGKGVYIALIIGDSVKGVYPVCQSEEYVCSTLTVSGMLVITRTDDALNLRLFDSDCNKIGVSSTASYKYVKPFTDGDELKLFVNDGENLGVLTVGASLAISKSNFVYPLAGSIEYAFALNGKSVLIVQTQTGIGIVVFSQNGGFSYKSELLNCRLRQILPAMINDRPGFALLTNSSKGLGVNTLDGDLRFNTTHVFDCVDDGVLFQNGDNYALLTGNDMHGLCSHFEWQFTSQPTVDETLASLSTSPREYLPIEGATDKCVISFGDSFAVATFTNGALTADIVEEGQNVFAASVGDTLCVGCDARRESGFGKNDVYIDVNHAAHG